MRPEAVKPYPGVLIEWVHETTEKSIDAAHRMCAGYQTLGLQDAPAAKSNHSKGLAIDVSISWSGALRINDATATEVVIETTPRDNMNVALWALGATYGVKRYHNPGHDKPHWSFDGL
jgi:D-alanyl-D-alanine dipeptidase